MLIKTAAVANHQARRQTFGICLLLALVTIAVYWPVARCNFVGYDDPSYVAANPHVESGLRWNNILWAFQSGVAGNWHPVTLLSHMLDCEFFGVRPAWHHLTNLALHTANTLLVFICLRSITGAFWRSALVAALFSLHPLRVESVAWISERKDVLSGFFGILALLAYGRYAREAWAGQRVEGEIEQAVLTNPDPKKRKLKFYFLTLLCLALGLMSKPMLVTWPALFLLLDYWPLARLQPRPGAANWQQNLVRLLLEKIPFFILSLAFSWVTILAQKTGGTVANLGAVSLGARAANAVYAYVWYIAKTFWPTNLAPLYTYVLRSWGSWRVWAAALSLAIITAGAIAARRRRPYFLVGWFWFLGTLIPVIGLVQVGMQSFADRYSYLPQLGLLLVIVWGCGDVRTYLSSRSVSLKSLTNITLGTTAVCGLLCCGILTQRQVSYWRNTYTLFKHAADVTHDNYIAFGAVAGELFQQGRDAEAADMCHKALAISPCYPDALDRLGQISLRKGDTDEALANFRKAISCSPARPDGHYALAVALLELKQYPEAEAECRETLRLDPEHFSAMLSLGTALQHQGKLEEAAALYRRILEISPTQATSLYNLGNVLAAQGKTEEAIQCYLRELRLYPADAHSQAVVGTLLVKQGHSLAAEPHLLEALRYEPTNVVASSQLAFIYQARNQMGLAAQYYRKTLASQPDMLAALNNLAWILAASHDPALRNGPEAITFAQKACQLTGETNAVFLGTLAAAYAEAGHFPDAIAAAQKSRDLALAAGQPGLAERSAKLLERFQANRPYHEGE